MVVAAVILAAGESTRMPGNKLLLPIGGQPMIAGAVDAATKAGCSPIIVVAGYNERAIHQALKGREVQFVSNPSWELGLAGSLRIGIAALPDTVDGALIMLGDMPLVKATTIQTLKTAFSANGGKRIVYPAYEGRQGNPVLFPARFFEELLKLQGDRGAKALLQKYTTDTVAVPVASGEVLLDCDTEADYTRALSLLEE
ncbi:MAG: nucleotidyltransferase family protein [Fidelibacterota bacterium]|nr:MAG: nucleotidyltransferase family protein [Candidatus Neomarinimicrobiota bacterium]